MGVEDRSALVAETKADRRCHKRLNRWSARADIPLVRRVRDLLRSRTHDRNRDAAPARAQMPQFGGSVVPSFEKMTADEQVSHMVNLHGGNIDRADNLAAVHHDLHRGKSVHHVHFSGF